MNESTQNLENRISALEQKVDLLLSRQQPSQAVPSPVVAPAATTSAAPSSSVLEAKPSTSQQMFGRFKSADESQSKESATNLLPLIAVICFVLAGVFMVRLAIESGWLTAERQWGLVTLLGAGLLVCGRWIEKIEKEYRTYLSAAGIIVLYIAAFSSSLYFEVFPKPVSLVMAFGVSGLCLMMFDYHRGEFFAVLTSVGTYISPILLGAKEDLIFEASFFLIWACVFSFIANYLQTRILSLTAAYLGIGVFTMRQASETDPQSLGLIISVLALQFLAFAYGVYAQSIRTKTPMSQRLAMAYLPILLFFYGTAYYFLNRLSPESAPWISLCFAGVVYALYRSARSQMRSLESQQMIQGFLSVVIFHSGYLQILPDASKPWLLPVLLLMQFISEKKNAFPKLAPAFRFLFLAIGVMEFSRICYQLVSSDDLYSVFPGLLTLVLGLFYYFKAGEQVKDKQLIFLGLLHLMAVLCLYRIAYSSGSLAVSLAWGVYSVLILGVGYMRKDASLAKSSVVVLLIASLKALVYDSSQAPSIIRIGSLLVTGALLYGAGLIFRQVRKW